MQRTLKRESKVLEIVEGETVETPNFARAETGRRGASLLPPDEVGGRGGSSASTGESAPVSLGGREPAGTSLPSSLPSPSPFPSFPSPPPPFAFFLLPSFSRLFLSLSFFPSGGKGPERGGGEGKGRGKKRKEEGRGRRGGGAAESVGGDGSGLERAPPPLLVRARRGRRAGSEGRRPPEAPPTADRGQSRGEGRAPLLPRGVSGAGGGPFRPRPRRSPSPGKTGLPVPDSSPRTAPAFGTEGFREAEKTAALPDPRPAGRARVSGNQNAPSLASAPLPPGRGRVSGRRRPPRVGGRGVSVSKVPPVRATGTDPGADLGGSSKHSNGIFEDRSGEGFRANRVRTRVSRSPDAGEIRLRRWRMRAGGGPAARRPPAHPSIVALPSKGNRVKIPEPGQGTPLRQRDRTSTRRREPREEFSFLVNSRFLREPPSGRRPPPLGGGRRSGEKGGLLGTRPPWNRVDRR